MSQGVGILGAMAKTKTTFRCYGCGANAPRWEGRCHACGQWNTLVEVAAAPSSRRGIPGGSDVPCPISQVDPAASRAIPTGVAEVDHVLGGGLVAGSVTLLGGEPGIGKSTLLLQVLASIARRGATTLYVSAEESKHQVRARADRLDALDDRLLLVAEGRLDVVAGHVAAVDPRVVAIDSIQAIHDPSVGSGAGSVSQVRECAARLVNEAKSRGVTVVMVGHVTKDGSLAGPRVLEHLVDTVLTFEGDRHHSLRLLRTVKHRFGSTNELGLFEMGERGLLPVADPSKLFLADRRGNVPGSVVVPAVDGNRSLLVEVQGLVASSPASPRRAVQGLDSGRFPMIVAVLQQRVGVKLAERDVYALVVGGVRVAEPAADLAICVAISSSALAVPVPTDLVVIGEVGLGGEVRQVTHFERRIMEAARLGFERAVVPYSSPPGPPDLDIELIRVRSVCDALDAVFLGTSASV